MQGENIHPSFLRPGWQFDLLSSLLCGSGKKGICEALAHALARAPPAAGPQVQLSEDQATGEEWSLVTDRKEQLGNLLSREEETGGGRIRWKFFILEKLCR